MKTVLLTTLAKPSFLVFQNRFHVLQHPLRLDFDVPGHQVAGGGINWNLAGAEKEVPGADRLVVRPHGGGRAGGFNDCLLWHNSVRPS